MPQMMISADRRRRRRRKRNRPPGEESVTTVSSDASALAGNVACRDVWVAGHQRNNATLLIGNSVQTLPLWSAMHGRMPVSNLDQRYARTAGGSATVTWLALAGGRDGLHEVRSPGSRRLEIQMRGTCIRRGGGEAWRRWVGDHPGRRGPGQSGRKRERDKRRSMTMPAKHILYSVEARSAVMRGMDKLAEAVKATLGPKGRNVVIDQQFGAPLSTKDGVTVAKAIELKDRFENMGAQLLREVASKTSDVAGDGTTTATILAQAIFREGMKHVTAGANPMEVKRGIDGAVEVVIADIRKLSRPIKDKREIAQVGTISANNDPTIGDLIAEAMEKVGKDGVITVEEATSLETSLEVVEGMQFDRGYLSPYFVTNTERMEAVIEDAYLLLHEKKISNLPAILILKF